LLCGEFGGFRDGKIRFVCEKSPDLLNIVRRWISVRKFGEAVKSLLNRIGLAHFRGCRSNSGEF
jgi:hypothetical protein